MRHDGDRPRDLVVGQPLAAPLDQLLWVGLLSVPENDQGLGGLAPDRIRDPDHCGLRHGRVTRQCELHLPRVDIQAAHQDQVRLAIHDVVVAVRVHPSQIAGVIPAVAQGLGRLFRAAEVPLHHVGTTGHDLSNLAHWHWRPCLVHNPQLHLGYCGAHRTDLPHPQRWIHRQHRRALRRTVPFVDGHAVLRLERLQDGGRERRTPRNAQSPRREVQGWSGNAGEDRVRGGDPGEEGHPMFCDGLEGEIRAKARLDHDGGAQAEGLQEQDGGGESVEHGQDAQEDIHLGDVEDLAEALDVAQEVPVGEHGPLRVPGRPRCVQTGSDILRRWRGEDHRRWKVSWRRPGDDIALRHAGRRRVQDQRRDAPAQVVLGRLQEGKRHFNADHGRRPRILQDVSNLRRLQEGVQGNDRGAGRQDAEVPDAEFRRVRQHEDDPVALPDTQRTQDRPDPPGRLLEPAVGQAAVSKHERRPMGKAAGANAKHVQQRHGISMGTGSASHREGRRAPGRSRSIAKRARHIQSHFDADGLTLPGRQNGGLDGDGAGASAARGRRAEGATGGPRPPRPQASGRFSILLMNASTRSGSNWLPECLRSSANASTRPGPRR